MQTLKERFNYYTSILTPIPLPEKCLVVSDIHAASGGDKDPLAVSGVENALLDVLRQFLSHGYTLFKNGDWWDCWRGGSLMEIYPAHSQLRDLVMQYWAGGKLYETLGNHERDICTYPLAHIFQGFGKKIFMWHGWFEDWPNDEGWKIGRDAVKLANSVGIDPATVPSTSPHQANAERHLAVRKTVQDLCNDHPDWDFLWSHTHYFDNTGNNHNSGSSLYGKIVGYTIEEGVFIPL